MRFKFNLVCSCISFFLMITDFCVSDVLAQDTEMLKKGVVKLSVTRPDGIIDTGAGIIIGVAAVGANVDSVFILTALHVVVTEQALQEADLEKILDSTKIEVAFRDFPGKPSLGKLFPQFNEELDLAIVYVKLANPVAVESLSLLKMGNLDKIKELDKIIALGHPSDSPWQVSEGNIGKVEANKIQYSGDAVYPGNSGGALLNRKGHLIGVVTRRTPESGFAVKMDVILDKLNEWNIPVQLEPFRPSKKWWYIGGVATALVAGGTVALLSRSKTAEFPGPPGRP